MDISLALLEEVTPIDMLKTTGGVNDRQGTYRDPVADRIRPWRGISDTDVFLYDDLHKRTGWPSSDLSRDAG